MSMTRKHFTKFADLLACTMPSPADAGEYSLWQDMGQSMMDIFKGENPKFDREKFQTQVNKTAGKLGKL